MKTCATENILSIRPANRADLPQIESLLSQAGLPRDGFSDHLERAFVALHGSDVIGSAAVEAYHDGVLLRSVAVMDGFRGTGVGSRLVEQLISRIKGLPIYLLTTTAPAFFESIGFRTITRADVPPGVRESRQFTTTCPATAIVMMRSAQY